MLVPVLGVLTCPTINLATFVSAATLDACCGVFLTLNANSQTGAISPVTLCVSHLSWLYGGHVDGAKVVVTHSAEAGVVLGIQPEN